MMASDQQSFVIAAAVALFFAALAIAITTRRSRSTSLDPKAPVWSVRFAIFLGILTLIVGYFAADIVWRTTALIPGCHLLSSAPRSFVSAVCGAGIFVGVTGVVLKIPRIRPAGRVLFVLFAVLVPGYAVWRDRGPETPPLSDQMAISTSPALDSLLEYRAAFSGPCGRSYEDADGTTKLWLHCASSLVPGDASAWVETTTTTKDGPVLVRVCPTSDLGRTPLACTATLLPKFDAETYVPMGTQTRTQTTPYKLMSTWEPMNVPENVALAIRFSSAAKLWIVEGQPARESLLAPESPTTWGFTFDATTLAEARGSVLGVETRPLPGMLVTLLPAAALVVIVLVLRRERIKRARWIETGRRGTLSQGRIVLEDDAETRALARSSSVPANDGAIVWLGDRAGARETGYRETAFVSDKDLLYGERSALVAHELSWAARADLAVMALVSVLVLPFATAFACVASGGSVQSYLSFGEPPRAASPAPTTCPAGMELVKQTELTGPLGTMRVPAFCADPVAVTPRAYDDCAAMNKCTSRANAPAVSAEQAAAFCGTRGEALETDEERQVRRAASPLAPYAYGAPVKVAARPSPFVVAPGCEIACADDAQCGGNPSCRSDALDPLSAARGESTTLRCVAAPKP